MRAVVSVLLASCMWGCAGTDAGEGGGGAGTAELSDEPGSTRASREAAASEEGASARAPELAPSPGMTTPTAPTTRPAATTVERRSLTVTVTRIAVAEAEDGQGHIVAANDAIALDLDARRFPPGGIDPVLHVGDLVFRRYEHPRIGVLRFTCADRSLLPAGARAFVQYGDDPATRVIVSNGLVLP